MVPSRAFAPCIMPGCRSMATRGTSTFCSVHERQRQCAADRQRGTSSARGYDATWRRIRNAHLRCNPICADPYGLHVGITVLAVHVDHIISLRHGGSSASGNLQSLCASCHSRKTAREDGGFGNLRSANTSGLPSRTHGKGTSNLYGSQTLNRAGGLEETPAKLRKFPQEEG